MAVVLFVRVQTDLEPEELERRMHERLPRFREVPGLLQKIYGRDMDGTVCGIYFFADRESLVAFRSTELAKTIPSAYEATRVRRDVYEVICSRHPERGPLTD